MKYKIEKVTHASDNVSYKLYEKCWFGTTWRYLARFDTLESAEQDLKNYVAYPYTTRVVAFYNEQGDEVIEW